MSETPIERPTKVEVLKRFRECGLQVDLVFDVGVMFQTAELREVYPEVVHHLFEPVAEFHHRIGEIYDLSRHVLVPKAVGAVNGSMTMLQRTLFDEHTVTHSRIVVEGGRPRQPGEVAKEIEVITLDGYCETSGIPSDASILLKIDVDGNEPQILAGATAVLQQVSAVIIETPLVEFGRRNALLESAGFLLHDICDLCYYGGMLTQFDSVYLPKATALSVGFNPFVANRKFDRSLWKKYP